MELLEVVTQGLVGAPEMVRQALSPTVTVLGAGVRERLLVRIVLDLLYPKGTEPTLADLDDPSGQSRAALTVQGRDGQRYRLLQDVHTGRRALQKVVGDKAETMTSSANEIAQAVTATLGFPQEDVLRELLFCVREDLPSQRTKRSASSSASSTSQAGSGKLTKADKPLPPGFDGAPSASKREGKPLPPGFSDEGAPVTSRNGRSDERIRNRMAEIDEQLRAQEGIKDLEFEIDGLQKKVFEIDARLRPLVTMRRSVEQAEAQLVRFHSIDAVPSDLPEKAERLRKARSEHDRDAAWLEEERDRLVESSGTLDRRGHQDPMRVAQEDPLVRGGVIAGVAAIFLGVLGAVSWSPLQWAALLDIPAFGVALFGGMRVLNSLEHGESVRRRVLKLDADKKRLVEKLAIDQDHVKAILDRAGFAIEALPDVEEQLIARDQARRTRDETRAALAASEGDGDTKTLEAEQQEMQARIRVLEEKLQGQASFGAGGDLLQEREELEAQLRGDDVDVVVPAPAPAVVEESGPVPALGDDLAQRQIQLARDALMASSIEDVATQVQPRVAQILSALTDGRYVEMRFGTAGESSVVDGAAGVAIAFGALPPFDRDLAFLSVKIALIELVVKRGRIPVVFDRGLDGIADSKGGLLKNMLSFLSSSTQVVSISEKPSLGGRPG